MLAQLVEITKSTSRYYTPHFSSFNTYKSHYLDFSNPRAESFISSYSKLVIKERAEAFIQKSNLLDPRTCAALTKELENLTIEVQK